jgi:3',5'-nucleoside bisphosphate phosphatase
MGVGGARRIDLHAHSVASDGTDTPAELMRAAAAAGLDVVALTDHDGTAGWAEAAQALPDGLTLLPGVELSAAAPEGDVQIPIHLLAYLVDPTDGPLRAECEAIAASRVDRAKSMIDAMVADGHRVSWDRVRERAVGTVGRPHVATELLDAGLIASIDEAFTDRWIGAGGQYYRSERKIPAAEAIALVRGAGGVPIFAHPGAHGRGETVLDATIVALADVGLAGIEVDHPDHDEATRHHLRGLAADLGLLVTGSSDYHGSRKQTRLGDNLTAPEVYDAIVASGTGSAPMTAADRPGRR